MRNIYKSLEFNVILEAISKNTAFSLGEQKVLNLEPSLNSLLIKRNLSLSKEIMEMINLAENYELSKVSDVTYSLDKVSKDMSITGLELIKISDLNDSIKEILNTIKNSEVEAKNLDELVSSLVILDDLSKEISFAINSYGEIKDSASRKLSRIKNDISTLTNRFDTTVNRFLNNNKDKLADSISSERNNRKVILLNSNYKNTVKGVVHGESQSGLSVYFEPESFITFNNDLQSLRHAQIEEENLILLQLSVIVKSHLDTILNNLNILSELDMHLAIAKWGYANEAIIADISDDHSIYLESVAHPLIDRKLVVRNTYQIKDGTTLIVSGPNTGGKTVTLKTIGLSILMSMCGIPIIADKATLPIVDNIFIDLGDEQSVVSALSTFSSHLVTLSDIVNNVSENSLVMLDELGSGTDPKEGEALAVATLEYLRSKKAITLVTTHLSGLKTYAANSDDIMLASVEFDTETLSPTYRFIEGLAGQSNALEIASKFNFPKSILSRAFELKDELLSDEEKIFKNLEKKERELLVKSRQLEENQNILDEKIKVLDEKMKLDEDLGSEIINQAKLEANKYIVSKQKEADDLYEQMLVEHRKTNLENAKKIKENLNRKKEETAIIKKKDHVFKVGDHVKVEGMNHIGQIVELDKKNATVTVNNMNIKTKLNKLEYFEMKKKPVKSKSYQVKSHSKAKLELNLIGLTIYEAMPKLNKFIDNAVLNNIKTVTVIHGVGSGKLRVAVINELNKNKNVKSIQSAPQSSGGLGATLVEIK